MKFRQRILTGIISAVLIVSSFITVSAEEKPKLQLYFAPQIMNDQTGEITVDADIRNFDIAVSKAYGEICAVTFSFEYDREHFDLKTEDDKPKIVLDDDAMVKNQSDIESKINPDTGTVTITFMDSTLMDNLISEDGKLFSFVLVSKEPKKLWNSFDEYPIRFVPGTIGVVAYRISDYTVLRMYNVEAIDGKVGGYNKQPSFVMPSIDKRVFFTLGENEIEVNGETVNTDTAPFRVGEELMIPVRYIAESIGMKVEWDGSILTASAYGEYKTLKIRLKSDAENSEAIIFVNSSRADTDIKPIEKDGRIYIPVSVIKELYPNAEITETENSAGIYIP